MKKRTISIMAILALTVSLCCTGCGNNNDSSSKDSVSYDDSSTSSATDTDNNSTLINDTTEETEKESTTESKEKESVQPTEIQDTTETENQVKYSLEDGKYQVSETFNQISEYDKIIFDFVEYSDAKAECELGDVDFLIEQMNKYKDRIERCFLELDNYDEYEEIKECKISLKKYSESVLKLGDTIMNDLPSENDNKYLEDDYFDDVYPYRDAAGNDVYYIWDAY